MATLGIKQSAWQAATDIQKRIMRVFDDLLMLGNPARYSNGTDTWLIFDDHRFRPLYIAYLGCFAANIQDMPPGYSPDPDTDAQLRSDMKTWIENPARTNPLVTSGNWETLQDILDAQGAPAWIKIAGGIPDGWTPVESIN
jgi:hypothetical protein